MKLIQTFTNDNKDSNRIARIYATTAQKGLEALHVPTYELSCHNGGIDVDWTFESFKELEDAQLAAMQWIAPIHIYCRISH